MRAARAALQEGSASASNSATANNASQPAASASPDPVPSSTSASSRQAVFREEPEWRREREGGADTPPTSTPLDLVAQLRGDFEAYTRDVYSSMASADETDINASSALDEMRERRQNERLQLDSLHARLHGLRLILAMAQLNVAANTELDRGERVELMSEAAEPNVVLVSLGRNEPPAEPVGVPPKQLEELLPKQAATADEAGQCCSVCICDIEVGPPFPSPLKPPSPLPPPL